MYCLLVENVSKIESSPLTGFSLESKHNAPSRLYHYSCKQFASMKKLSVISVYDIKSMKTFQKSQNAAVNQSRRRDWRFHPCNRQDIRYILQEVVQGKTLYSVWSSRWGESQKKFSSEAVNEVFNFEQLVQFHTDLSEMSTSTECSPGICEPFLQ